MDKNKFDPEEPVQFRDAPEKVRILATDLKSKYPIVIAVTDCWGDESIQQREADGRVTANKETPYDLVNVPKKHEVWINFYNDGEGGYDSFSYSSQAIADESSDSNRIACVRVKFTEGEGL